MKKIVLTALMLCFIVVLAVGVNAFGVTSSYWSDRPLYMAPGETKEVDFRIQNMIGDTDLTIRAELKSGTEIARLIDKSHDYFVPFGTQDTKVNVRIIVPSNAAEGTKYSLGASFTTITPGVAGGVAVGSSISKYFDVIVRTPGIPEAKPVIVATWLIIVIVVVVIIIIILLLYFFLWKKGKRKVRVRRRRR